MRSQYRLLVGISIAVVIATSSLLALRAKAASPETGLIVQVISYLIADDLVAVGPLSSRPQSTAEAESSDEKFVRSNRKIEGRYIVVLDDEAAGPRGEIQEPSKWLTNSARSTAGGSTESILTLSTGSPSR